MFQVEINKSTNKFFKNLPRNIANKVSGAVFLLSKSINPESEGIQLTGINPKAFRIRVGVYRVIYRVNFEEKIITIYKIGHRKDVYKF